MKFERFENPEPMGRLCERVCLGQYWAGGFIPDKFCRKVEIFPAELYNIGPPINS